MSTKARLGSVQITIADPDGNQHSIHLKNVSAFSHTIDPVRSGNSPIVEGHDLVLNVRTHELHELKPTWSKNSSEEREASRARALTSIANAKRNLEVLEKMYKEQAIKGMRRYKVKLTWNEDVSFSILGLVIIGRHCNEVRYYNAYSKENAENHAVTRFLEQNPGTLNYGVFNLKARVLDSWIPDPKDLEDK